MFLRWGFRNYFGKSEKFRMSVKSYIFLPFLLFGSLAGVIKEVGGHFCTTLQDAMRGQVGIPGHAAAGSSTGAQGAVDVKA